MVPLHVPFLPEWDRLLGDLRAPLLTVGTHGDLPRVSAFAPDLVIAAPRGDGLGLLLDLLLIRIGATADPLAACPPAVEAPLVASARQADLLRIVARELAEAEAAFPAGPAVVAEAMYRAVGALDAVFGRDTREDVLDRLFARFCVGK